jgi:hypothetical protein
MRFRCVLCGRSGTTAVVVYPDGRRYLVHRRCLRERGWW